MERYKALFEKKLDEGVNFNKVLNAYLYAGLWSSTDDNDEPLDSNYDVSDIDKSSKQQAIKDVKLFIKKAGNLLNNLDDDQIGHDFLLTRNGHGAGFWDRGLGDVGEQLTKIAETFREVYFSVENDQVYID